MLDFTCQTFAVQGTASSFPFQNVVGDYFSLAGMNYLVMEDRFSGWLSIYSVGQGEFDAKTLVKRIRGYFCS